MIEAIRQHLENEVASLAAVKIAEDVDAIVEGTNDPSGTCYVVPHRERAKPNTRATGGHLQEVTIQYVVAFVIQRHSDAKGAERAKAFDDYKTEIQNALAGWWPDFANSAFELVGGEASGLGNGRSVYAQTWETTQHLTGA